MSDVQTVNKRLDPAVPVRDGPLKVWPRNYNRGDIYAIAESIRVNGFFGTIVVQESTGYILAGNHTFQAAQLVGLGTLAVAWVDVDDEAAKRIALADNLTARLSEFDDIGLAQLLAEVRKTEQGLAGTGMTEDGYRELLAQMDGSRDVEGLTDPEEAPSVPAEQLTVSVPGDIWVVGPHRIGCGSSLDAAHVGKLFAGRLADLVVTDPPYNVAYEGKTKDRLKIANDAMTSAEFKEFLLGAMRTTNQFTREGGCIYVAYAEVEAISFHAGLREGGYKYSQTLVWVKNAAVMSRQDYNWRHEPILFGWKEGKGHYFNKDYTQTTVLDDTPDFGKLNKVQMRELLERIYEQSTVVYVDKPNRNDVHPTMKPLPLFERLIRNSSRPGDLVYDPFGGSGTTLIASHKTGRECVTGDLDPRYVDVIVERLQNFSGLTAYRESDGRSFNDLKAERISAA